MIKYFTLILSCLICLANQISSLEKGSSVLNQGILAEQSSDNPSILRYPSLQYGQTFQQYKLIQRKSYSSRQEQQYRQLVYQQNLNKINKHNNVTRQQSAKNSFAANSVVGFTMALNKFADLSEYEFRQIFTKTYPSSEVIRLKSQIILQRQKLRQCQCQISSNNQNFFPDTTKNNAADRISEQKIDSQILSIVQNSQAIKSQSQIPVNNNISSNKTFQTDSNIALQDQSLKKRLLQQKIINQQIVQIDWTKHTGKIRYQGSCGSCYAFSAVDALSSMNSIFKFGFFVPLSPQQILDCSSNGLTFGCNGGFIQGSYAFLQYSGVTTEYAYKYQAKKQQCKIQNGTFKIDTFRTLQSKQCSQLINQLRKKPIAVGIAGYRLQFYSSGVFDDCNTYIDHAVLLIGYKSKVGWKIKNSWGTDWGMSGFAWIKDGNNCGICQNAVVASITQQKIF